MKSKALLPGPTGNFRQVDGDVISPSNQLYYRSLSDDELLQTLRQSLCRVQSGSLRMTKDLREHLLPALLELRKRYMQPGRRKSIPDRPTYYEVLRSLNLNPDTGRKWFTPTVSAAAVLRLVGPGQNRRRPSRPPVQESAADVLLGAADKMAAELLGGNIEAATRLAREYLRSAQLMNWKSCITRMSYVQTDRVVSWERTARREPNSTSNADNRTPMWTPNRENRVRCREATKVILLRGVVDIRGYRATRGSAPFLCPRSYGPSAISPN